MLGYTLDHNTNKRAIGALGYQDESTQKKYKIASQPSKVVHLRNLPPDTADSDLVTLAAPFGKVTNILHMKTGNQAFIQMENIASSAALLEYYGANAANIRGHTIYFQYSTREEIVVPSGSRDNSKDANLPVNSIVLATITNVVYPITIDVLQSVFSRYGQVLKIVIFSNKNGAFQSLIQYSDTNSAANAKNALDGQNIYVGCCTLKIQFSSMAHLEVKYNNEKSRDFTNPNLPSTPVAATSGANSVPQVNLSTLNPVGPMGGMSAMGGMGGIVDPYMSQGYAANPGAAYGMPGMGMGGMGMGGPMAGNMMGAGGMGGPSHGSVVIVGGLTANVIPDTLFTLFGVYGDVHVVKILYNKKDTALVQMATPQQADIAISNLNHVPLFGSNLKVNLSKHPNVNTNRNPAQEQDQANFTRDYSQSPLHRFKKAGSKNFNNICPPNPTLHISNIPPTMDEVSMTQIFSAYGEVKAFKFFATDRKMALVQFSSTDESVQALVGVHNRQIDANSPNHLRVSFAKAPVIKDSYPGQM